MAIDNVNNGDSGGKVRTVINSLVDTINIITNTSGVNNGRPSVCAGGYAFQDIISGSLATWGRSRYAYYSKNACTSSFPWLPVGELQTPIPNGSNIVASYYATDLLAEGSGSVAHGKFNTASGFYTHAEGYSNKALSYWSHAEGDNTQATNSGSHSEGGYTTASGWYSHAEGWQNIASGKAAHVEGYLNQALGGASHAEGWNVTASGEHAHAEGNTTRAVGNNAHSEGENTYAYGRSSHVEGNQTITFIAAAWSHAEGSNTTASGSWSHTEGTNTITRATGSHSEGYETLTLSSAFESHVEGYQTQTGAAGLSGIVSGSTVNGVTTIIVAGDYTAVFRSGSMALTYNETAGGGMPYGDMFIEDIALDSILTQNGNSTIIYILGITAYSDGDVVLITRHDNLTDPDLTTFFGGPYSHAEGKQTIAANIAAHSEGRITYASGYAAHSEGYSTKAYGRHSHAEGDTTVAKGEGSHAEGKQTIARGNYSHAEGRNTEAFAAWQHATGQFNILNNTADYFVIGDGTGPVSRSNALGVNADRMYASNSIYFPDLPLSSSQFMVVFDTASKQIYYTASCCTKPAPPDMGIQFNSGGALGVFDADSSFLFDYNLLSLLQGNLVVVTGQYAHAEGGETEARGTYSHAEGFDTIASGGYSHAEGFDNIAYGYASHVEGQETRAYGLGSHAEGHQTNAAGNFSHAEGALTFAGASTSHAEGVLTTAFGTGSHAEGYQTTALGDYSHASGIWTITSASGQTAVGQYNLSDNSSSLFVVGTGDSVISRYDSFKVEVTKHVVMPYVSESCNYANDLAAAAGDVPLGGIYHTNGVLKIRLV